MPHNQSVKHFSLEPFSDGAGGNVPGKYWVYFQQHPIPGTSPNVLDDLPIELEAFVDKANALFNKHNVRVPEGYPKDSRIPDKLAELLSGGQRVFHPWREFIICIYCCTMIEENHNEDTSKILRKELIEPNSWHGILHACAMSVIASYYLDRGHKVEIQRESLDGKNPDLVIDGIACEIKTVRESDWVAEAINENEEEFFATGHGKRHDLAKDICYDVGTFSRNRGHKGIRQSDLIFADLSLKSLRRLMRLAKDIEFHLPELRKHRVIFFARKNLECTGFYIDFDPNLWELIKTADEQYRMGRYPPLRPNTANAALKQGKSR
jgi:hypothetical protein